MAALTFAELAPERPDLDAYEESLEAALRALDEASDASAARAVVQEFEDLRRTVELWSGVALIRFRQATGDPARVEDRRLADSLEPRIQNVRKRFVEALLASPHRAGLEAELGAQAFALWERERDAFDPKVADELVEEKQLEARYTALLGGAKVEFEGQPRTMPALGAYLSDADPVRRAAADRARWSWFADNGAELDELFDELVAVRTRLARKLGHEDFRAVGYARMKRVDYDADDVARFRNAVLEHVVPLVAAEFDARARRLGLDRIRHSDERVHRPEGSPQPRGDGAWMIERASEMFAALQEQHGGGLADLFEDLRQRELLDLESRDGKGAGGFCAYVRAGELGDGGRPFVFANFNGTTDDARVFTHEMGHAYQGYLSRAIEPFDCRRCTSESAEIHSMSLEYLTWPEMERFFGDDADEFRRQHLVEALAFLPYGCAIDHFQHSVYAHPDWSAAERRAEWQRLEARYLPWRDYGGAPHASEGGAWQRQLHVYQYPFYYIDYVLAGTAALQFWAAAEEDRAGTWERYHALCAQGGSLPFRGLLDTCGIGDPFEGDVLAQTVGRVARWLEAHAG